MNRKIAAFLLALVFIQFSLPGSGRAAPVDDSQAMAAAAGWLNLDPSPLARRAANGLPDRARSFSDERGHILYYMVYLTGKGLVVVAGDDRIQPVIAWLPDALEFSADPANPLYALLEVDLRSRLDYAESRPERSGARHPLWPRLFYASASSARSIAEGELSDVRIEPFVESKWSQGNCTVQGQSLPTYNYYTPNYYVCGCVATAMAQLMLFHQHPTTGVGTGAFEIEVDGVAENATLRGGDGIGGDYDWSNMVLVPHLDPSLTDIEREAIGALTYDAGISVNMSYEEDGSGADTADAADRFVNVFGYANAIANRDYNYTDFGMLFGTPINTNLDASFPVILGILDYDPDPQKRSGHAVVCDGYGYQDSVPYHHLNMGWSGAANAWYNLPDIGNDYFSFDMIYKLVFNVFPDFNGEIISGRVTDGRGHPVAGAGITATRAGGGAYTATTDANGIYALAGVPSDSSYTVSAVKTGHSFTERQASTTLSVEGWEYSCGNVWGVDFTEPATPMVSPAILPLLLAD